MDQVSGTQLLDALRSWRPNKVFEVLNNSYYPGTQAGGTNIGFINPPSFNPKLPDIYDSFSNNALRAELLSNPYQRPLPNAYSAQPIRPDSGFASSSNLPAVYDPTINKTAAWDKFGYGSNTPAQTLRNIGSGMAVLGMFDTIRKLAYNQQKANKGQEILRAAQSKQYNREIRNRNLIERNIPTGTVFTSGKNENYITPENMPFNLSDFIKNTAYKSGDIMAGDNALSGTAYTLESLWKNRNNIGKAISQNQPVNKDIDKMAAELWAKVNGKHIEKPEVLGFDMRLPEDVSINKSNTASGRNNQYPEKKNANQIINQAVSNNSNMPNNAGLPANMSGKSLGSSGGSGGFMHGIGNFLSGISNAGKEIVDRAKAAVETSGKPAVTEAAPASEGRYLPRIDSGQADYPKYGGDSAAGQELAKRLNWLDVRDRLRRNEWSDKYKEMTKPENLQKMRDKAEIYEKTYNKYVNLGLSHKVADKYAKDAGGEKLPIIPDRPGDESDNSAINIYKSMRTDETNAMTAEKNLLETSAKQYKTDKEYNASMYDSKVKKYAAEIKAQSDLMRANAGIGAQENRNMIMRQGAIEKNITGLMHLGLKSYTAWQKGLLDKEMMSRSGGPKLDKDEAAFMKLNPQQLQQLALQAAVTQYSQIAGVANPLNSNQAGVEK